MKTKPFLASIIALLATLGSAASEGQPFKYPDESLAKQAVFLIAGNKYDAIAKAIADPAVVKALEPLQRTPYFGEARFIRAVTKAIGEKAFAQHRDAILRNAIGHPFPQPMPKAAAVTETEDDIVISTGAALFDPAVNPFDKPPGSNFLPTIYTNVYDGNGVEIANTLPSTSSIPYNLHPEPKVTPIDPTSPTDDLRHVIYLIGLKLCHDASVKAAADPDRKIDYRKDIADFCRDSEDVVRFEWRAVRKFVEDLFGVAPPDEVVVEQYIRSAGTLPYEEFFGSVTLGALLQRGLDILEGNRIPKRKYSGFPLLHYKGPEKVKRAKQDPKTGEWNVDIRQIWYDSHIECDTALFNPVDVWETPFTMTYIVDVLNRGEDDFSPFAMFTDDPKRNDPPVSQPDPATYDETPEPGWPGWKAGAPHVGFDQTFFPMEDGTRTVFKVKMPPGKYWHLTYTWGWRMHPPRIQVIDRATKEFFGKNLVKWETDVFTENPTKNKEAAISNIGDLAPAKRLWNLFKRSQLNAARKDLLAIAADFSSVAVSAYDDWKIRTRLPSGIDPDPNSDLTLLYANNTIYGEFKNNWTTQYPDWNLRGDKLKITILNADYFEHGYANVDFGGHRGWENQFKSSVKVGGSGCWFTFGRTHWIFNSAKPMIRISNAVGSENPRPGETWPARTRDLNVTENILVGRKTVDFTFNFEPSRRLRFYQFDPLHHDVAIFSIH